MGHFYAQHTSAKMLCWLGALELTSSAAEILEQFLTDGRSSAGCWRQSGDASESFIPGKIQSTANTVLFGRGGQGSRIRGLAGKRG